MSKRKLSKKAEDILDKHEKSSKNKYIFTTRDNRVFGCDDEKELEALREAVLEHNAKLRREE